MSTMPWFRTMMASDGWMEVLNDTYGLGSFDFGDAAATFPSTSQD
jgi:hypothetical protein